MGLESAAIIKDPSVVRKDGWNELNMIIRADRAANRRNGKDP